MIEIKGVCHSLGGKKILNDINLTLAEGSVMGLVGINGAGKTTLLRLISGVYTADEGEIIIDGESIGNESAREKLFFLPDDPYFTSHTTGKSLFDMYKVFYPAIDRGVFLRRMKGFGLDEKKPIRNFSKGMRRQLFIALALAVKPKYLLLDEAFDGLDPLARHTVRAELAAMADEGGATIIISSHSLTELESFCDKYAVIDNKSISSSGDIAERVEKYCKFMLGFADGFSEEMLSDFPVISIKSSGKFVNAVFDGDAAEIAEKLKALSPTVIEEVPIDFEEIFISEVSKEAKK